MRLDSLIVEASSLDALANALRVNYSDCSELACLSGNAKLLVMEKYYFRNNSHTAGVALLQSIGKDMHLVSLIAAGARSGLLALDYGAEDQFIDKMKGIILKAA